MIRRRDFFIRIVSGYIAFACLLVALVVFPLQSRFSTTLENKLIKEYLQATRITATSIQSTLDEIRSLYFAMRVQTDVDTYMTEDLSSGGNLYRALLIARKSRLMNSYIHSISLYNAQTRDFFSTGDLGIESAADFIDQMTVMDEPSIVAVPLHEGYRQFQPMGLEVVALLYPEMEGDTPKGLGAVCLYPAELSNRLMEGLPGDTFWLDEQGRLLSAHAEDSTLVTAAWQAMDTNAAEEGTQVVVLGTHKVILSYVYSPTIRVWLLNVRDYAGAVAKVQGDTGFFFTIGLIVLAVGLILSYLLSRFLYQPISSLTEALAQTAYAQGAERGEISMLSQTYRRMLDDIDTLQKHAENSLPHLRENFLRQALLSGLTQSEWLDGLRRFNLRLTDDNLIVVVLQREGEVREGDNPMLPLLDATAMVSRELERFGVAESVRITARQMAFLYCGDSAREVEIIRNMRATAQVSFAASPYPFTLAIAAPVGEPGALREGYQDAVDLLKYRYVLGDNQVIDHQLLENQIQYTPDAAGELKILLGQTWQTNQRDLFEDAVMRMIERLSTWPYQEAYMVALQLGLQCYEDARNTVRNNSLSDLRLNRFLTDLRDCETLIDTGALLVRLFETCQALLAEQDGQHNSNRRKLAVDTCRYIEAHSGDPDLSVEGLAALGGYTPNYFSGIFKGEMGVYLNEYIRKVRMNRAIELLANTKLSVQQIAEQTGFRNASYFYTTFKKELGVTPQRYRERAQHNEHSENE